jgi:hypothetical protein
MRSAIAQAVGQKGKATDRRRPKDVTGTVELTRAQRVYRRVLMREHAHAAGLPEPSEADYETAGVGRRKSEFDRDAALEKQRATKAAKAETAVRLCSLCFMDLRNQKNPNWRCMLSRCIGPFTKSELKEQATPTP